MDNWFLRVVTVALILGSGSSLAIAATIADGGPAKRVLTVVGDNDIATTSSTVLVAVPKATRTFTIPPGGNPTGDLMVATFSAECYVSNTKVQNWVVVEIQDNGVPIKPTGVDSPLAFCSDELSTSAATQVVKRLAPGQHVIRVMWRIRRGTAGPLSAIFDDWALTILLSE